MVQPYIIFTLYHVTHSRSQVKRLHGSSTDRITDKDNTTKVPNQTIQNNLERKKRNIQNNHKEKLIRKEVCFAKQLSPIHKLKDNFYKKDAHYYSLVQSKIYLALQTEEPCVDSTLITKLEAPDTRSWNIKDTKQN